MTKANPHSKRLDERLFARSTFVLSWIAFLAAVVFFVSWPLRNIALVCWVYGSKAYFTDGVRVLPGKPVRFSTGVEAPALPDFVTGLGAFIITVLGLTILLIIVLRIYERWSKDS